MKNSAIHKFINDISVSSIWLLRLGVIYTLSGALCILCKNSELELAGDMSRITLSFSCLEGLTLGSALIILAALGMMMSEKTRQGGVLSE